MSVDSCLAVDQPSQAPSFRLKGGLFPLTLLELTHGDLPRLRDDLKRKVAEAPGFFQQAPAVLSLETFDKDASAPDLHAIQQLCLEFGLIVVALRGADETQQANAKALNLAILANSRVKPVVKPADASTEAEAINNDAPATDDLFSPEEAPVPEGAVLSTPANALLTPESPLSESDATPAKIITTPVRSGQQVYAAGGDLIVLAPVSAGAELLADGNIHVYGALRGRALAGVKGNTAARIFCQSLEAELISIAGYFQINEDLRSKHWKKAVQASLTDETLNIEPI